MSAVIAIIAGAVGGFVREILGRKGVFAFPKWTDKNLALGGLVSVICGAVAGVLGLATYNLEVPYWWVSAIIWGLGWSDVFANVASAVRGKR